MAQHTTQRTAEAVRAEMARRQVKPGAIAELLGCSRQTLWRRLNGFVPFDVAQLEVIANRLDVPVSALVAEDAA